MSVAIAIGNDVQDINNIQNTISILKYVQSIGSENTISTTESSSSFETLESQDIDNLIDWYTGIVNILVDPSLFSYEESNSNMI
jgi:hypothetical protein